MSLAAIHHACRPGERVRVTLPPPETLARRTLLDALEGAGFTMARRQVDRATVLTRQWTLPDTVGPGMRLLVCGLNPSPAAADAGVGFARPGNRFWPAAIAAGLVERDRDPTHALVTRGVGMTDIVKRTTRRADELSPDDYQRGLARLERVARLHRPRAVCFVGLAGWRTVRDRRAGTGWQPEGVGEVPVYLMGSTSGLNANDRLEDFVAHFRAIDALSL